MSATTIAPPLRRVLATPLLSFPPRIGVRGKLQRESRLVGLDPLVPTSPEGFEGRSKPEDDSGSLKVGPVLPSVSSRTLLLSSRTCSGIQAGESLDNPNKLE